VSAQENSWVVPSCSTEGCQIRYRFLLADASASIDDLDVAIAHDGAFLAPPSTWLVRPLSGPAGKPFRFHVSKPRDVTFVTGVFPSPTEPDTFRADIADLPSAPYSAFGRLQESRIDVGGRTLEIAFAPGIFAAGQRAVLDWIQSSADVVAHYYGQFPVTRALLLLLPTKGSGFGYGKALGNGGASILVPIGQETDPAKLADDWVLVHEMVHLGFPSLARQYIWLEEGIATYVEPIARARMGRLSAAAVWGGLLRGLPNGLPASGDQGLDNTHTWGRTYWGGALFCLIADVEIRERTQNKKSVDDALRGVLMHGGNIAARWEVARALEEGDKATGLSVLRDLHQRMGSQRYDVDLAKLWKRLGVKLIGNKVVFDDNAPLAEIRRSITGS
jgi:predicted metalloprotease with PDZ domain